MPASTKSRTSDRYDLEGRLERIIHFHLLDMEENPEMYASKDRLAAIQYVGMFLNRKYGWGEPEAEGVGSAVRKYAGAFRTPPHGTGARTGSSRPTRVAGGIAIARTEPEPDLPEDTAA